MGAPTAPRCPVNLEAIRGTGAGPAARVLVITATCGSLEPECRAIWASKVDQIVLGALEFGYNTIDPRRYRSVPGYRSFPSAERCCQLLSMLP